jgi:hypothetical protein
LVSRKKLEIGRRRRKRKRRKTNREGWNAGWQSDTGPTVLFCWRKLDKLQRTVS